MAIPPCQIVKDPKPQWAQTYIIKGCPESAHLLRAFAYKCDVLSFAITRKNENDYLVITFGKGSNTMATFRHIKENLAKFPGPDGSDFQPEWVRVFTRRFQQLFRWEKVEKKAIMDGDSSDDEVCVAPQKCFFWEHPLRPLPFFVLDQEKPNDPEKLEWLLEELDGVDIDIHLFSKTFLKLFGSNYSTETAQKTTVLRLFGKHQGRKLKKGIDLPPEELEWFELAWNPDAPARCRACSGPVADVRAGWHSEAPYCGDKCKLGVLKLTCKTCEQPSDQVQEGWFICKDCGQTPQKKRKLVGSDLLSRSLVRTEDMMRLHNNYWKFQVRYCEPEMKRRKRT